MESWRSTKRARSSRFVPQSLFQVGAYFVGPGMVSGLFSMRFIPEAYDVQAIHLMCKGVFTNTPQAGPYRGAGRPEAAYFTERMIEHAAKQIGMDVAEICRVNLHFSGQISLQHADLVLLRFR